MAELRLFNSRTKKKEIFTPLSAESVGMYSCGPTVYARQHLGNLRAYVFADLVKRTVRHFGHRVRHVINITDVGHLTDDADAGEDKMERAAAKSGASAWDIAAHWTRLFQSDLMRVGVEPPDVWAKATDHIPQQIDIARSLERKGLTYVTDDGLYLDTSRLRRYGQLSPRVQRAGRSQDRVLGVSSKRNRNDFALWKRSRADGKRQMQWESPWGVGFPGWHIECVAMSTAHLGTRFDIHTGGVDHIPIHHENEIAQAEAAFDVHPWVPFWLHGGWLTLKRKKMSKSRGSMLDLDELVTRGLDPLAYRLFLLGAHYRAELAFTDEAIADADRTYRKLRRRFADWQGKDDSRGTERVVEYERRFDEALADDVNTPKALAVLWEIVRDEHLGAVQKRQLGARLDTVLALSLNEPWKVRSTSEDQVELLVVERDKARVAGDWVRADALRTELVALGVTIEDTAGGSRWYRA